MTFTPTELDYLANQRLGRLATAQPNGTLQVSPVGFTYNPTTATIDIVGFRMAASRKFRNVADNGRVALVVDDVPSVDPWRVRCLEIRGRAEAIEGSDGSSGGGDGAMIRIHPERIISFGIDEPDRDVHELAANHRNVTDA
jgi:pyridoxamine 5'-phosphate oxidase family protein